MIFTRSSAGLQNMHIFHGVDFIVYCEGGTSFSHQQVKDGKFSLESIDSIFWNKVFSNYSNKKFKFKPIGSKAVVKLIAKEIMEKDLKNVLATMDQEFDMIFDDNLIHPNIKYTYGYSWENDVWCNVLIKEVLEILTAKKVNQEDIDEHYTKFIKKIMFFVRADAYQASKTKSFFPRPKGHMKLVECNMSKPTKLKNDELDNLIDTLSVKASTVNAFGRKKEIDVKRNCYGHLFGDYCKQLVHHILKTKMNLTGIKDEYIKRVAIGLFLDHMSEEIDTYYKKNDKLTLTIGNHSISTPSS